MEAISNSNWLLVIFLEWISWNQELAQQSIVERILWPSQYAIANLESDIPNPLGSLGMGIS